MAALVTVSLGSNINPESNIRQAVSALREQFGAITLSPVYQTAAVGFDGEDFLNLVVSLRTDINVQELVLVLKAIEDKIGRDRSQPRFSARQIDLDLLTYDDLVMEQEGVQIPRHEILQNAFVLKPLSDIRGKDHHPVVDKSYHQLWREMELTADRIELYPMEFD